jgi:hypothetical protein
MAAAPVSRLDARPTRGRRLGLAVALGVIVFNAVWVAAALGPLHKPKRVLESDHLHYIEMARSFARAPEDRGDVRPELALRAPYCWRVLVPGTVALLVRAGVNLHLAFYLLTNLSLVGFLYVLFVSLEDLGFDLRLRLVALLLVGLMQGAVRWFEYQYWMTDPEGLLLVAWGVLLARRERLVPLGALALLAAFVRETFVIVYPFAFFVRLRRRGLPRALLDTAALAAGPALATLALRRLITPAIHPGLWDSIVDNVGFRVDHLFDNQLYVLTLGTWGVLLPLALVAPRPRDLVRRHAAELSLVAFVYASTVLISNNNDRPLAYALQVVLPPALAGLRRLIEAAPLPAGVTLGAVVALQALFYVETRFTGLGISIYQPVSWPVVAALGAFWLGAFTLVRRAAAQSRSQSQMA